MPIQILQPEFIRPIYIGTWAGMPSAAGNAGKEIILTDMGRSRLWSNGTYWRPVGGRQVLAQRSNNPVTVQSLAGEVAETIGPFPGGLVRAGMRLEANLLVSHAGITTSQRIAYFSINSNANGTVMQLNTGTSGGDLHTLLSGALDVRADGLSSAHRAIRQINKGSYDVGILSPASISIDFSAPWSAIVELLSAAETAVNISSATWAGGIATFNTSAPHTLAVGDKTVIAGVTPSGWNIPDGAIVLSVPTTTQFTVAMAADPGAYTSGGTSSRISNMISQSYVLELVG